jgi:hypothetical protein
MTASGSGFDGACVLVAARPATRRLPPRSSACASTPPCHLAHDLLDYAEYLSYLDDDEAAGAAVGASVEAVAP